MEKFIPPNLDYSAASSKKKSADSFSSGSDRTQNFKPIDLGEKPNSGLKSTKEEKAQKFSSSEFIRQDSLLTNVEDYSKRIRFEADNYAFGKRKNADEYLQQAEEELAAAKAEIENSREEAKKIILEAENSASKIRTDFEEKGFKAGLEKGMEEGRKQNQNHINNLLSLLKEMEKLRSSMLLQYEKEIVNLVLLIAQKVVLADLSQKIEFVQNLIQNTISRFEGLGNVRIRINPTEYDFVVGKKADFVKFLDEDQIVSFKADISIPPGASILETEYVEVENVMKKQFEILEEEYQTRLKEREALLKNQNK